MTNPTTDWPRRLGTEPFYGVPIFRQRSINSISFSGLPRKAIHRTPLDGMPPLYWYVNLKRATTLRVVFTGAIGRDKVSIPKFNRVSTSVQSEDAFLAFSDPALALDPNLGLAWYVGNEECDPAADIIRVIERVAHAVGATNIVLVGGSGGGFAALRIGALIKNAGVYVFSPQTKLSEYHPPHVRSMLQACFPSVGQDIDLFARKHPLRNDIARLYATSESTSPIYYFQNINDRGHVKSHFEPFIAEMQALEEVGARERGRFRPVLVDSIEGHGEPTATEFVEHLDLAKSFFSTFAVDATV